MAVEMSICLIHKNYERLSEVFKNSEYVYIIFSSIDSKQFYGYATMTTDADDLRFIAD